MNYSNMKKVKSINSEERYFAERGFGQEIGFGEKPAILVIDMMNAFTDERLALGTNQDSQIKIICKILSAAREMHIPIFFTVTKYDDKDLSDAGLWFRKMKGLAILCAKTNEAKIDVRLERKSSEPIIIKKYASAFFGTDLITRLNSIRVDTIILSGCTTSGCIRATAVDAIQMGFRPVVVKDAVSDRSENAHKQSLFDLQAKYADVVESNNVISYLYSIVSNK